MKKIRTFLLSLMMIGGLIAVPVIAGDSVYAANKAKVCEGIGKISGTNKTDCADADDEKSLAGFIRGVINVLLFLIGAIAVIMIIIGGLRYVTSNGDQAQLTSAKNTILYAVVGVVVAIMAFAIVNFVVRSI